MTEIDVIIQRLAGIEQSVDRVARAVEKQNGRIGTIERAREREAGAREERAQLAIDTAATLAKQDKSRAWKISVYGSLIGASAVIATVAGVIAQVLYHN